ncbi:MAG: glutathione-regulated potassium-efflux system protein KefB [Castellaniella sp.]|uniref:monovalent cation:proton antiporter-2 (CPA2) family protein n=1 Tax=Castellaniella sp. TaxID=1955812 RepID=UPI00120CDF6E|nr:monovalent cation:proton antiporter-2 (CPA2) family protein [Castellaniella sp.]TAN30951.1 MAG: glutathione-regulated potassium-efflux system protein KefB [Castellaniella sp.]
MSFLPEILVFLIAACVAVPLSRKSGFGSVLGYLIAGVLIGPWGLQLITGVHALLSLSQIGVVLMMFIIGLELQPSRLWALRRTVFGIGALQVAATTALLLLAARALGVAWVPALIVGFGLSLSSTAFVLQMLAEKKQLTTHHGRAAFGTLLFQDIAAIPVLAVLKVFTGIAGGESGAGLAPTLVVVAIVVALLFLGGRYALRWMFGFIMRFGTPEIFTALALLIVIGASLAAERMGLSMGLGAFVAGMLLADSKYRHEFEADIEPFKGLLLGLFFVAVGMSVNLGLLAAIPLQVLGVTAGFLAVKALVLYGVARAFGLPAPAPRHFAVVLALGGEFAFVIFATAAAYHVFPQRTADLLNLAVTLSMVATPFIVMFNDRVLTVRAQRRAAPEFDTITDKGTEVVIAGFGRFGQIVGRVLRMQDIPFTALDADLDEVNAIRRFGNKVYFGDASRLDLLRAAHLANAKIFVLAIDDVQDSVHVATLVHNHFPGVQIYARARNRHHDHLLRELGVKFSVRETLYSSLELTKSVMEGLGLAAHETRDALERFRRYDQELLDRQYAVFHDEKQLQQTTREVAQELEHLLSEDTRKGR